MKKSVNTKNYSYKNYSDKRYRINKDNNKNKRISESQLRKISKGNKEDENTMSKKL